MEKNEHGLCNLYVSLFQGKELIGVNGSTRFMLAAFHRIDTWSESLVKFTKDNFYEDYSIHRMSVEEGRLFIDKCRKMNSVGVRLGQAMIIELDDKTPTPNIDIFSTLDDAKALAWFYENHVISG